MRYLLGQLLARKATLRGTQGVLPRGPSRRTGTRITAGQRVQVIKWDKEKGGVLQFGTEVVAAADGSIAGLARASPGASTAVPIMLDVLERCFPDQLEGWKPRLPGAGCPPMARSSASSRPLADRTLRMTAKALELTA